MKCELCTKEPEHTDENLMYYNYLDFIHPFITNLTFCGWEQDLASVTTI